MSAAARPLPSAWPSYATIGVVGYAVYGVGAVVPFLRADLGLSATLVGLHPTALAVGFVVAGTLGGRWARSLGDRRLRAVALVAVAAGVVVLAAAPHLAATLVAALAIGTGAGLLLGLANEDLAAPGGIAARTRVARANVWAMVAAFACPPVLALGAATGIGWWLGLVPALPPLVALLLRTRAPATVTRPPGSAPASPGSAPAAPSLPAAFWLAWAFVVAVVAVEFSFVVWGATLVAAKTGTSTADAALIAASFLAGMFAGRLALGAGLGHGLTTRASASVAVLVAGVGAVLVWLAPAAAVGAVGLFVAGLGTAALYPLGIAAALSTVPEGVVAAGARLTLASGAAILAAPLVLGALSDAVGVVTGWWLVLVLAGAALALARTLPVTTLPDPSPA